MMFGKRTVLAGSFDGVDNNRIRGWVSVPDGASPAVVQIHIDGQLYARVRADLFRPDLRAAGVTNGGRAAFDVPLRQEFGGGQLNSRLEVIVEGLPCRLLGGVDLRNGRPVQGGLRFISIVRGIQLQFRSSKQFGLMDRWPVEASIQDASTPNQAKRVSKGAINANAIFRDHAPNAIHILNKNMKMRVGDLTEELKFRIFGHIDGHYSLSIVNRGIALSLDDGQQSVVVNHFHGVKVDGVPNQIDEKIADRIVRLIQPWQLNKADDAERISICHHYPLTTDVRPARLRLCFFFWEESRVPADHVEHINEHFDAVLVATQFVRKVLRDSGCFRPIRVVPIGVEPLGGPAAIEQKTFDRHERFRFLHVSSAFPRKGIDVLLSAYFSAFTVADDVELVIKTFPNIHNTTADQLFRLRQQFPDGPLVVLDERHLTDAEMADLYHSADAVVLPTRGEGFNLPAAEAMRYGIPVISTGYGGQWDFLTGQTGWCIDFEFAHAATHVASTDSLWLEPSKDHLKETLIEFYLNRNQKYEDRFVRGQSVSQTADRAKNLIEACYNWENTGQAIRGFAQDILAKSSASIHKTAIAWVSSWNCRCGIAEYSRYLTESLNSDEIRIEYICDSRTAASPCVRPLFVATSSENLSLPLGYIASREFDAVVVQYQPSLFDLASALPQLAQIQESSPVFLFMHSTRHFHAQPPSSVAIGQLRRLERIFVHTLDDVETLREFDVIENVVLFRHGVSRAVDDGSSPKMRRLAMRQTLAKQPLNSLSRDASARLLAKLETGDFWLASFGFLLPHKGISQLIHAVRILHDKGHTHIRLLLLCATLDERSRDLAKEIRILIAELDLAESVVQVDEFLNQDDVKLLLAAVDLLVFPYQETLESASGAIRLGLASGRPILTTPLRIFDEVSRIAFQSQDTSSNSIAEMIGRLCVEPDLIDSKNQARDEWIAARDWDRLAQQLSSIIRGTLADRALAGDGRPAVPVLADAELAANPDDAADELLPLCPAGVSYPKTGRARPWLAKSFSFKRADGQLGSQHKPIRWNSSLLSIVLMTDDERDIPLHIARTTRGILRESILHIDADDLDKIPPRERVALLDYARRHHLRTAFWGTLEVDSKALRLADMICGQPTINAGVGASYLIGTEEGSPLPSLPRAICGIDRGQPLSELMSLRRLDIIQAVNCGLSHSPLLQSLAALQGAGVDINGRPVIRFGEVAENGVSWRLLSTFGLESDELASFVERFSAKRTAFLVDRAVVEAVNQADYFLPWLLLPQILIFESPAIYQRFFSLICRQVAPVAILRNRAVLLDCQDGPPGELPNRLARLLRTIHPIRLTDVYSPYTAHDLVPFEQATKTLTICVSTYNRANWLQVTLPLLIKEAKKHLSEVEFLVVDNTSTDNTPQIMGKFIHEFPWIRYVRNDKNVGMLGNLAVSSRLANGKFVWIVGDDDLVKEGTVSKIIDAVHKNAEAELVYINYAYTHFDKPSDLKDIQSLVSSATLIAPETPTEFKQQIRDFAARNENFFTAIYACVFRRDHALAAYGQFTGAPPFSDLASCIPTTKYVLEWMLDRPGVWIGSAQIVVNMNVSWMGYAPVWHFERLPEAYNLAEEMGVPREELSRYRESNLTQGVHFASVGFSRTKGARELLSMCRYIENARAVKGFDQYVDALLARYQIEIGAEGEATDRQYPFAGQLRALYKI